MTKKKWIGVMVAAIIIIPIVFNSVAGIIAQKIMAEQKKRPTPVDVAYAETKDIYPRNESVGRIEAKYSVDVVARINGWLQKSYFKEGAYVNKGQTLFLIQPNEYIIAVHQAEAAVRQAQAALTNSQKELVRAQELVKNDFVSKSYYDQALATRDQNRATLDVNKANLAAAKLNLSYTKIESPVDGKVGKILITQGNLVNPQSGALTRIVSVSPIYAYFNIKSEDYLRYMKRRLVLSKGNIPGTDVIIKLSDGSEYKEKGVLEFVNNEVDPTAGTVAMRAVFENKDHLLVPGDFVNVIAVSKKPVSVVVVPQIAVSDSTDGTYVWTVNENNEAEQKFVKISNQVDDKWVVDEGLQPGDRVITKGFQRLRNGAKVVVDKDAADKAAKENE